MDASARGGIRLRATVLVVLPLLGLAFAGLPVQAASFTVTATDFAWTPAALGIEPGESVTFANGGGSHTWVRDDGSDSCALPCTRTFATAQTVAYHCGVHPSMRGTVTVGPPIDLTVSTPSAGAVVAGLVRVAGVTDVAPVSVTVRIGAGTTVAARISGTSWEADVDTLALAEGAQDVLVRAHAGGPVDEVRVPIVVDNPDRIDLAVASLSAPPDATRESVVSYTLRNRGNVPSGAFVLRAEYLDRGEWRPIGDAQVASIAPGGARSGAMPWTQAQGSLLIGKFTIRATADPAALVADVDRANNARTASGGWATSAVDGIDLLRPV